MGTISSPRAIYGLFGTGTPTKTQSTGDIQVGVSSSSLPLTGATKAYCVSATLASAGNTLTIDTETGIATVGTAPVSQVETATVVAASGATSNGNLAVTVTAARVTGTPVAVTVALTTADNTASLVATKIRAALTANTAIAAVYTVGGTGADVRLTEIDPENNDSTLNIAWPAALGVSAVTTSMNTTTGVGGVKLTNNTGDGKDFEGVSLGEMADIAGLLLKCSIGSVGITLGSQLTIQTIEAGEFFLIGGIHPLIVGSLVLTATSDGASIEATIIAT